MDKEKAINYFFISPKSKYNQWLCATQLGFCLHLLPFCGMITKDRAEKGEAYEKDYQFYH